MLHWVCKEKGTMLFGGFELSQISSNYCNHTQKKNYAVNQEKRKKNYQILEVKIFHALVESRNEFLNPERDKQFRALHN